MRWTCFLGLCFAILFASGCSEPIHDLSGKVTLDGKPLPGVTVSFFTTTNAVVNADTDAQGNYKARVPGTGQVRVSIQVPPSRPASRPNPPSNAKARDTVAKDAAKGDDDGKMARMSAPEASPMPPAVQISPKYNDPAKSGFDFTLTGDTQVHDLPLISGS